MKDASARRIRVTVTLPARLVERIDRQIGPQVGHESRSAVIERLLEQGARRQAATDLERATIAYYESLSASERAEDEARSAALSSAARRLDIDGDAPARRLPTKPRTRSRTPPRPRPRPRPGR